MYQLILVIKLSLVKNFKKYFLSHFEQIIAFSLIVKVISKLSTITLKLAKITHFPMAIFYISIYFIINVFLNDATRFCSKMPLIGDSCCTETCRARRSTGDCAMEVFTAWHYRTDKRYKTLLLFNLFFFINKFQLPILTDHHFESITIVQEKFFLSFRDIC